MGASVLCRYVRTRAGLDVGVRAVLRRGRAAATAARSRHSRMSLSTLFDVLQRVAPRITFYPRWAQRLFLTTLAFVLVTVFLYIAMAPSAADRREARAVALAVSGAD